MSQMNITRILKRKYTVIIVLLIGIIIYNLFNEDNLTLTENIVGRAIYIYTLFRNVVSLDNYEEIEKFRKGDCSIYKNLIFGFSSKNDLGIIVEHNIGHGENKEWNVLDEYESLEIENIMGNRHWIEFDEFGELTDGISMDMDRQINKDDLVVNFIVSKELLERNYKLKQNLTRPIKCSTKKFCSDLYFNESKVKIIYENDNISTHNIDSKTESPGIVVFVHGGGFVFGDFDTYERTLQRHAIELGKLNKPSVIAYIEYRKSPKWRYPIPLEDVIASISWIHCNAEKFGLDPNKLVILGDSAGGNLATSSIASCLSIKDQNKRRNNSLLTKKYHNYCKWVDHVKFLGLIYPALCQKCITNSKLKNFRFGFLNLNSLLWFEKQYQSKYIENYFDWRSQPLLAPANILRKFPKTSIVLMKSDILYDEGRLMYEILLKLKVNVKLKIFTGFHGIYGSNWLSGGSNALEFINSEISEIMN
ncbi:esterase [Cryptosporidium hominis]